MKHKNKKGGGEVGQTVTWIVATLIIIAVTVLSIYATSVLKGAGDISNAISNVINSVSNGAGQVKNADIIKEKTLEAFMAYSGNGQINFIQIRNDGNLNDASGNKAEEVMNKLYGKAYQKIWFGVEETSNQVYSSNNYFKLFPNSGGEQAEIELSGTKYAVMILAQKNAYD